MDTVGYSRTSASAVSHASSVELARIQMLKAVKTQFYIHKSFDIQSDMEFLPAIPTEYEHMSIRKPMAQVQSMPSPVMSPSIQYSGRPDAYHSPAAQLNELLKTPKSRPTYMNQQSPKQRTPTSSAGVNMNFRKRVVSNTQVGSGGIHVVDPSQIQQLQNRMNVSSRNW